MQCPRHLQCLLWRPALQQAQRNFFQVKICPHLRQAMAVIPSDVSGCAVYIAILYSSTPYPFYLNFFLNQLEATLFIFLPHYNTGNFLQLGFIPCTDL